MTPEAIINLIHDAQASGMSTLEIIAIVMAVGWAADKVWFHRNRIKNGDGKTTSDSVECVGAVPLEAKIDNLQQSQRYEHEAIKESLVRIEDNQ